MSFGFFGMRTGLFIPHRLNIQLCLLLLVVSGRRCGGSSASKQKVTPQTAAVEAIIGPLLLINVLQQRYHIVQLVHFKEKHVTFYHLLLLHTTCLTLIPSDPNMESTSPIRGSRTAQFAALMVSDVIRPSMAFDYTQSVSLDKAVNCLIS